MENLLINYLFTNCKALAKEFLSQEKASTEEGGGALDFLSILNGKMGSIITVEKDSVSETAQKDLKGESPQEGEKEDQKALSLSTQNIFTLLQTYFHMKNPQETNLQGDIEKFLNDVFDFLQEGESVEFVKEKGNIDFLALMKSDVMEPEEIAESIPDGPQKKPENMPLIGYLAAMFHQMANIEKTNEKSVSPKVEDSSETGVNKPVNKVVNNTNSNTGNQEINSAINDLVNSVSAHTENITDKDAGNNAAGNGEKHKVAINKEASQVIKTAEVALAFASEGKQSDDAMKHSQKFEVKKIDSRENVFQIITRESTATEGDDVNKNISVLTIKAEKATPSRDDDSPKVVFKVSDKEIDNNTGKDERQLLPQNDYIKMSAHTDKETAKVTDKTAFASMMADRIEKITEQYANKTFSMDMVIRLKIDDKESILVGLKEQGNRISVEVKTTNEGMGNFLQSQKEEIAKQLEGKFVYANIYVDVQNEGSQKKEQKEQQKKQTQEEEQKDFGVFLEALA